MNAQNNAVMRPNVGKMNVVRIERDCNIEFILL